MEIRQIQMLNLIVLDIESLKLFPIVSDFFNHIFQI